MKTCFPGTLVDRKDRTSREFLFGIFSITSGMMLSHIRELTGLDTPALQNWVARGYVARPKDKKYAVDQVAKIFLINMLRDIMKMENIGQLFMYMTYNSKTKEHYIKESEIYNYVCDILDVVDFETVLSTDTLRKTIIDTIKDYNSPANEARERLINGLQIILVYYASVIIKNNADRVLEELVKVDKAIHSIA